MFTIFFLIVLGLTNYRAYTNYKAAEKRLEEVEKRYKELEKKLESRQQELEALKKLLELHQEEK
ncbi:MAG: hypothetical protein DRP32_05815 [Thermotogae bacterium]|uniref:Uncharacterized protein n=1 Tax=Kosmotoga arenicorallina TaxID=688066 RepID=A0A7C5HY32_9BACT|nr:hypothetical protein [Kosmotoga sp.]MCD6159376.1 hypothetical protein [Kosmotoga sp.]RKX49133.1 MAG: hypothetical protein DRP32_05815 [Thermotogota bacterium]HHF08473.1 hypothetical protein [Kosmotoga arenicorallina]